MVTPALDLEDGYSCCFGWYTRAPVPAALLWLQLRKGITETPTRTLILGSLVALMLIGSQLVMMFAMNFMLQAIVYGNSSYVSNIAPAVFWAVLYLIPCIGYHLWRGWRPTYLWPNGFSARGLLSTPITRSLLALGTLDAFGGITATYAAPHVPMFLQTLLSGFGVLWTFILTRWFVPITQVGQHKPQLTLWAVVAFSLTIAATVVAAIPQRHSLSSGGSIAWLLVFEASALLPVGYNVVQGRFMRQVDASPEGVGRDSTSIKVTMLTGDAVIQVFVILLAFPLDFLPWFGSHPGDPKGSFDDFVRGLECIFSSERCEFAGLYFGLYVLCFYLNHIAFSIMNHYSTTVTAFTAALAQPLNLLCLWWFPVLNVWGTPSPWEYSMICFLCSLLAAILFFLSEQVNRHRHVDMNRLTDSFPENDHLQETNDRRIPANTSTT